MRIAYVHLGADLDRNAGVTRKIIDQVLVWKRRGHDVRLFLQTYAEAGLSDGLLSEAGLARDVFTGDRIGGTGAPMAAWRRLTTVGALAAAVRDWAPALVYLRFTVSYPSLLRLVAAVTTVLEVNTNDLQEWRGRLATYKYLYHRVSRVQLLRRVAGAVFATEELAASPSFAWTRGRNVVIANGIALERYGTEPSVGRDGCRIAFMGEPGFAWHGIDKLLNLARACPEWQFDVIGYGPRNLGAAPPPNVRCHGYLGERQYAPILAEADVAVGTLALHRKGMAEACPLKVREYLARGLPTVIGYDDTDFRTPPWFLLQLPNRDDNVMANLGVIRAFVERMRGHRVPHAEVQHLNAEVKERRRLEFFERVLQHAALGQGPR